VVHCNTNLSIYIAEKGDQIIPVYNVDELENAKKVRHTLVRLHFTGHAKILSYRINYNVCIHHMADPVFITKKK